MTHFTKTQLEGVARVLREARASGEFPPWILEKIVDRFSDYFLDQSESFNPAKFRAAVHREVTPRADLTSGGRNEK